MYLERACAFGHQKQAASLSTNGPDRFVQNAEQNILKTKFRVQFAANLLQCAQVSNLPLRIDKGLE
jgi:hypothetical protein